MKSSADSSAGLADGRVEHSEAEVETETETEAEARTETETETTEGHV